MSLNYYTQTPNFISASADDIDPRTRLFSFNHSLTTLVGNYDMGPSLDLTLTYSPTTTDNIWGMGTGMMFTLTWYDKNARTLYLNSGETYRIDESTDGSGTVYFNMLQCKIKTFNVEKIDNGTGEIWYRVPWTFTYCNDAEIGSSGLRPLVSITMPTGLVKSVKYDMEAMAFPDVPNAPQYRLPAVKSLTISPGLGSPDIVTEWSFSTSDEQSNEAPSKNYLGYRRKPDHYPGEREYRDGPEFGLGFARDGSGGWNGAG
ncbi:hypothetical protein AHZ37_003385 [Salmonella enterica subsp. indica]|uniref:hypothetical protein n=1 Tax=Salmonella enterica TaxID=28901 RepID=UPI0009AAE76C|nr:hypothetical protein [Salmonella enterica]ECI8273025.1 hypothetical protein [Salmonella enterica subsp. enterica]EDR2772192.1 hypothetical protein [Salmonella enterica subsp. enterica serovar Oslo]EEC4250777.1 hypothetical protein [Salmonella enterica subsp. diarizonae]ECC3877628.1 hypothetical protein [Salmonella enterica subsp. indica]ECF5886836.1 hypothetical protein [Salmonella enterica subsp. indica]